MQLAFDEVIDTMAGRAALEVRAGSAGLVPEDVVETVRRVPGVELAVPVVSGTAFTTDGSGEAQMKEALLLGLAGLVLGSALGLIRARVLLPVMTAATALNFNVIAPEAVLRPRAASIGLATALGIGVALLAAWLPAARAVRVGSAAAIRGRDVDVAPQPMRTRLGVVALLAVAALAAALVQARLGLVAAGLVGTALILGTVALAATPLVRVASVALLPLLARLAGASGRLAGSALRDHPRRVGMSVATIAVGVGVVMWLWTLARSFEVSVVDALGRAIRADVVVTSANVAGGFLEAPMGAEVLDEVQRIDGVAAATGWRALEWPYEGGPIGISAYDGGYFLDRRFGEWPLKAGDAAGWEAVARGEAVVVSTSFMSTTGKAVGDRIVLQSPTGPVALPIVGVTVDFVSPRGTIEMSRALFSERWRDRTLTRISSCPTGRSCVTSKHRLVLTSGWRPTPTDRRASQIVEREPRPPWRHRVAAMGDRDVVAREQGFPRAIAPGERGVSADRSRRQKRAHHGVSVSPRGAIETLNRCSSVPCERSSSAIELL